MIDRIETLLEEPPGAVDDDSLARLETTLTDGYAEALRIDSDRIRIERRIDEVVLSQAATEQKAEELDSLLRRLAHTNEELERLRRLLDVLRDRARAARIAAARV